jgi:hypothetical protein
LAGGALRVGDPQVTGGGKLRKLAGESVHRAGAVDIAVDGRAASPHPSRVVMCKRICGCFWAGAQSCDEDSHHATCVVAGICARADTEIADAAQ